jgi:deazaflavin-dependent oxidoreductase (nitroreductase family)
MAVPPVDPTAPRSRFKEAVARFAVSKPGFLYLKHVSRHVDPMLHRLSRGRFSSVLVTPIVLLTTKGAKSGLERTTALAYFTDGERVVCMASNYGSTKHPAWYHNIKAHPEVTLSAAGQVDRYTAEETTGEDRERLWGLAKQLADNYGIYEGTAGDRTIPVIAFRPAT